MNNLNILVSEIDRAIEPYNLEKAIPLVEQYTGNDWVNFRLENNETYSKIRVPLGSIQNDFEIFIITWKPGQCSPIHDHAKFGCILKVLEGNLIEDRYTEALTEEKTYTYSEGSVHFMSNEYGVHSVKNIGDETAVSLHVYAPANHEARIFSRGKACT